MPLDLQLLKDGDDREWERAFDEYQLWDIATTAVESVIGRVLPQDVEDVAESALSELTQRAIHRCHSLSGVVPMLKTVAHHRAVDRRRRLWARLVDHPDQDLFDPADERQEEIRRRLEHVQERLRLDGDLNAMLDALVQGAGLNALEEALLREHIVGGRTQQEFAHKVGRPLGSVCRITTVLVKKIRDFLEGRIQF